MDSISLKNINLRYNGKDIIEDISLSVKNGEFIGIAGPNGAGKTTLLKIIDGIIEPDSGLVMYNNVNLSSIKRKEVAKHIAYLPQEAAIPYLYTVQETVLMGRYPHTGRLGFETKKDLEIVESVILQCGIKDVRNRVLNTLSGGERQRVFIARCLAQKPEILLLDEPTAHLDISSGLEILSLIKRLQTEWKLTVITASHDLNLISQFVSRLIFLNKGRVIVDDKPVNVLKDEYLRFVYGEKFALLKTAFSEIPYIIPIERRQ